MIERGYLAAMSRLARRAFELYIAHIIVVAIYIALVAVVSRELHHRHVFARHRSLLLCLRAIEISLNSFWVQILVGSIGISECAGSVRGTRFILFRPV